MCGNTHPKLLQVSYGRTAQQNKGLLTMSSPVPHSTEYRTCLECARPGGFQTLHVEHRTDSRRPLDEPHGTRTETDEDGSQRRRRRAKTETDEDGDRLTVGTSEVAGPVQLTTPQRDEDGDRRRQTRGFGWPIFSQRSESSIAFPSVQNG